MTEKRFRVAVVNSHPVQYFAPLYAYLSTMSDLEITVFYLSNSSIRGEHDPGFVQAVKWDVDLLSGYAYRFVGKNFSKISPAGFFSLITPEIWKEIRNGAFDAVWVNGHQYAANLIAIAAAKASGANVFMRSETHLFLTRTRLKAALRKPVLSLLYGLCDGLLAIGSANRDFYWVMGVPDAKITLVPYTVDNARFMRDSCLDATERQAVRTSLGIPNDSVAVLYASKLQRRKHPDTVVKAAQHLASEGVPLSLVIAGAGEMEEELKQLVSESGPANTFFTGFLNQSRLPKVLGACDVFVLPAGEENWGLVVNEAMCAGLPVVVGEKVGCVRDLVRAGENGFTVPAGDVTKLIEAVRPILTNPELRRAMSRRSAELIERWSYAQCYEGLRTALLRLDRKAKHGNHTPNRQAT
jgi:glycosyltransferase involved in cell wall biosynthesis